MKTAIKRVIKSFDPEQCKRDIDAELRFHLQSAEEHYQLEMTEPEAKAAALRRFGDVELVADQCLEISRRSHRFVRTQKLLLSLVFLLGVLVRVFGRNLDVLHFGDMLMAVAVSSRLFLYVRGLKPSSFRSRQETASPLMLRENTFTPIRAYDHRRLTPIERVIADK